MSWKIAALGLVLVVAAGAGGFTARQATSSSHSSFRNGYRSRLAYGPGTWGGHFSESPSAAPTTPPSAVPPIEPSPSGPSGTTPYPGIGSPVICVDGTLSYSGGRPGACSPHGGEP